MPIALLSVSDKSGLVEFGKALVGHGWDLIASRAGGSYQGCVRSPFSRPASYCLSVFLLNTNNHIHIFDYCGIGRRG